MQNFVVLYNDNANSVLIVQMYRLNAEVITTSSKLDKLEKIIAKVIVAL